MTSTDLRNEAPANQNLPSRWRTVKRRPALTWTRFLPVLLFFAFFLGNTRIPPTRLWLAGRWIALLVALGLTLLTVRSRHLKQWPSMSQLYIAFFSLVIVYQPSSANPQISVAKWLVFLSFLLFCALFYARVNSREDALLSLRPLMSFFLVFIWITIPASFYFPQSAFGMNSFLVFTGSLGAFLVIFGVPAALYQVETTRDRWRRLASLASLATAIYVIYASRSRISAFSAIVILGIALLRWKGFAGRTGLLTKILIISTAAFFLPGRNVDIETFFYKYPGAASVLESRTSYWQQTIDAFRERVWIGSGFGVQEQQTESELGFTSPSGFREQGSSYLGMLEELGILGATPLLLLLLITGLKNGRILLRSDDPLKLLLARSVIAGLLWGISCNYLLYLGGAFSLLLYFSVFLQERLAQLERSQRLMLRRRLLAAYAPRHLGKLMPEIG